MTHTVSCTWRENMTFESDVLGHKITLDADESVGGNDRGPRPKPLVLSALAGCTGMDVISILKKMRLEPTFFDMEVEGTLIDDYPKNYEKIHLTYLFKQSDELNKDKVTKAVDMSQEKYCGVSALLRKGCELTFEIRYI